MAGLQTNERSVGDADAEDAAFRAELIELMPFLRAFARTLSGHRDDADDLCQEALAKAWQSRATYQLGTNLKAWLFMILRNQFYSERRRSWRQQPWHEGDAEKADVTQGTQGAKLDLSDLSRALRLLSDEQREALILVGAGGFSYEEASSICGCALGTIKSRVARGRTMLQELLNSQSAEPLGRREDRGDAVDEILRELNRLSPKSFQGRQ
ncbi:MAG: sigma-70 family RNA polymerase sigma factor [Alphaproteobacteria bacterium]|nr:sigma-70 family RNA polymerase sigma factor [Alphaproteobacteria bacterium]